MILCITGVLQEYSPSNDDSPGLISSHSSLVFTGESSFQGFSMVGAKWTVATIPQCHSRF